MTPREELLETLLVERFGPPSRPKKGARYRSVTTIQDTYNDDELTTFSRRKTLNEACKDFDIPRKAAI